MFCYSHSVYANFFLKGNVSKNLFILHLLKEQVMYINVDKKDKYRCIIS